MTQETICYRNILEPIERNLSDFYVKNETLATNATRVTDITVIELIIALIFVSIIVNLWEKYLNNLLFHNFGLKKKSTYHTFVIAICITAMFITFIYMFQVVLNSNYFIT